MIFWNRSFQKLTSFLLIAFLLLSQTIRVSFFDEVTAQADQYRDIVSIWIDRDSYDALKSRVDRYAEDIQSSLGSTRVALYIISDRTTPAQIAAVNEKLYYEGDRGAGISQLVGTILIGKVPVPVVVGARETFPSLYPYVDFDEKYFRYDESSREYILSTENLSGSKPEIWHGVIDPSLGSSRLASDTQRIGEFLDKTHDFYTRRGVFASDRFSAPPRVYYYDGYTEQKALQYDSLFAYGLFLANRENFAYQRWSKHLLGDIVGSLNGQQDISQTAAEKELLSSLGSDAGGSIFPLDQIREIPDIQTRLPLETLTKKFYQIINTATLGEMRKNVYNAGRYNDGSRVRVDQPTLSITSRDQVALDTLKTLNASIEYTIDAMVGGVAQRIPLFDQEKIRIPAKNNPDTGEGTSEITKIYKNRFFGTLAETIRDPHFCSIARGGTATGVEQGRSVLVEANNAYNILTVESDLALLESDTTEIGQKTSNKSACFVSDGTMRLGSYWGQNTLLRLSKTLSTSGDTAAGNIIATPADSVFRGFSRSIFDLSGARETTRLSSLSPLDCQRSDTQYALLEPYTYTVTVPSGESSSTQTIAYPPEWNISTSHGIFRSVSTTTMHPRFTCISSHEVKNTLFLQDEVLTFPTQSCTVGDIILDGKSISTVKKSCVTETTDTTMGEDMTTYRDLSYHTIPSVVFHKSPTDDEILAAQSGSVTPSLPIDMDRFVEFLTPRGALARITYPNFFRMTATDIPSARAWLQDESRRQWEKILADDAARTLTPGEQAIQGYLRQADLPSQLDWNAAISDETLRRALDANQWMDLTVTEKYARAVESDLSLSRSGSLVQTAENKGGYEIAYLGLQSIDPLASDSLVDTDIEAEIQSGLTQIRSANASEPESGKTNSWQKCGSPDGVDLWQWPAAIQCWIREVQIIQINPGACSADTIGLGHSSDMVSPDAQTMASPKALGQYLRDSRLVITAPRRTLSLSDHIIVSTSLTRGESLVNLPSPTTIEYTITSLSGVTVTPEKGVFSDGKSSASLRIDRSELGGFDLQAVLVSTLSDGSVVRVAADPVHFTITSDRLRVIPSPVSGDITTLSGVLFSTDLVDRSGSIIVRAEPRYTMEVLDAISQKSILSGYTLSARTTVPVSLFGGVGSYTIRVQDMDGRVATTPFSLLSGEATTLRLTPTSSVVVSGGASLVTLDILDSLGNIVDSELFQTKISIRGGYFLDSEGARKTELSLALLGGQKTFPISSDGADQIQISASIENRSIQTTQSIRVIPAATVRVERDSVPVVDGTGVLTRFRVVDPTTGVMISDFSSPLALSYPEMGGDFSTDLIEIRGGQSAPILFTPGQRSGDHELMMTLPGVGSTPLRALYSVEAGRPLSVGLQLQSDRVEARLLDRYENTVPLSMTGVYRYQGEKIDTDFTFSASGVALLPRQSGRLLVSVPALASEGITITNTDGSTLRIPAVTKALLSVPAPLHRYDFAPDYSSLYTVLAGDSYLSEAADILYSGGASSSLAVTTLLTDPYQHEDLLRFSPSGGVQIGSSTDRLIRGAFSLEGNIPKIDWYDESDRSRLVSTGLRLRGADLSVCTRQMINDPVCHAFETTDPALRLVTTTDGEYRAISEGQTLMLQSPSGSMIFSVDSSGRVSQSPLVTVSLSPERSAHMTIDLSIGGSLVAQLLIQTEAVSLGMTGSTGYWELSEVTAGVEMIDVSLGSLGSDRRSITMRALSIDHQLDESKLGPSTMESLGVLSESPGVGWHGQNTMLLSFAAGETVGAATRWNHTYTMINLGDPVAHLDSSRVGTAREGIDRSIGTRIADSSRGSIRQTIRRDFDHDGYEDIMIWYTSGFAELILNLSDRWRSRGFVLHADDASDRPIDGGDFSGDGYADIVYTTQSGSLAVLTNDARRWTRHTLSVTVGEAPQGITQMKVYDMDQDGRDDIVYISEVGGLGILYGTQQSGVFEQKILESRWGVEIDTHPSDRAGAVRSSLVPQYPAGLLSESEKKNTTEAVSPLTLRQKVYYQQNIIGSGGLSTPLTFVRSEYARAHDLVISKVMKDENGGSLVSGDRVTVTVTLKNTASTSQSDIEYLDSPPSALSTEGLSVYRLGYEEKKIEILQTGDYPIRIFVGSLPAGGSQTISYTLTALSATYGEMIVGALEGGETGDDTYGDIGFDTTTTCGADMLLWRSTAVRSYERGVRSFSLPEIPESLRDQLRDADTNGIPDSVENMTIEQQRAKYSEIQAGDKNIDLSPRVDWDRSSLTANVSFDPDFSAKVEDFAQTLADGLSCGFGGGSCMSFPLNWAPLAPGSAPTVMGMPLSRLTTSTGKPLYSGLTGKNIRTTKGCFQVPTTYPLSTNRFSGFCNTTPGAGGMLGDTSPTNFFRMYWTPTLTLGMGTAICMGGPARVVGQTPPQAVSPVVPGGNCIVVAKAMPICKADGSEADGSVVGVSGLGSVTDSWNARSCTISMTNTTKTTVSQSTVDAMIESIRQPEDQKTQKVYKDLAEGVFVPGSPVSSQALLTFGNGAETDSVMIDSREPFSFGQIEKIKNKAVSSFPDFIMEWWMRQQEEITNALFSPPDLYIVPPRSLGQDTQLDGSWVEALRGDGKMSLITTKNDQEAFNLGFGTQKNTLKSQMTGGADSQLGKWYEKQLTDLLDSNKRGTSKVESGAKTIQNAYEFLGRLPFIQIEPTTIPLTIPWIQPRDLDKYERSLKAWRAEGQDAMTSWCLGSPDPAGCAKSKAHLDMQAFFSSIDANISRLEEYRQFPAKIQKYVHWKQRYIAQILCNVDTVEQMVGGWLTDNGKRFRTWVEFYILLKAIAKSWQPLIDILDDYQASCSVCRNERYDLKYFQFKLISAVMPQLPVLRFPRWPDIVLDLSDIRMGMKISMPEFRLSLSPIRLPSLGNITLPRAPTGSFSLPTVPELPPLPELPDLPDLPSLPQIKLAYLPPPPKIPKLFGAVKVTLDILKLVSKVMCIYQKTALVPEWRVGNVIAERTERQGTLPMDFLNIDFPQVTLGGIKEIRLSTHVDLSIRTDFITEMAKQFAKPVNEFTSDIVAKSGKISDTITKNIQETLNQSINKPAEKFGAGAAKIVSDIEKKNREINGKIEGELQDQIAGFQDEMRRLDEKLRKLETDMQSGVNTILGVESDFFRQLEADINSINTKTQKQITTPSAGSDIEVIQNLRNDIKILQDQIESLYPKQTSYRSPHPSPLPKGEGIKALTLALSQREREPDSEAKMSVFDSGSLLLLGEGQGVRGDLTDDNGQLKTLSSHLMSMEDEMMDLDSFRSFLSSQLSEIDPREHPALHSRLTAALREDHRADIVIDSLRSYHDQKYMLLRQYLQSEKASTENLQQIIDTLSTDTPEILTKSSDHPLITPVSAQGVQTDIDQSDRMAASLQTHQEQGFTQPLIRGGVEELRSNTKYRTEMTLRASSVSASIPSGYAPQFDGIFVLAPSGAQTRLFDYTAPLSGREKADRVDIDHDGDMDFIYLLDGALYVKYSHLQSPSHAVDTDMSREIVDRMNIDLPSAPDSFRETRPSAGSIQFSFSPARPTDRVFRLAFYDHMLEWDQQKIGAGSPLARRSLVDLIVESEEVSDYGEYTITSLPLAVGGMSSSARSIRMISPPYRMFTAGEAFALTPGRSILSGRQGATLSYRIGESIQRISVDPYQALALSTLGDISIESGTMYLFDTLGAYTTTDPQTILDMPIVAGSRIYTEASDRLQIRSLSTDTRTEIGGGESYMTYRLGSPQDHYSVSIPYENGWYYARLVSSSDRQYTTAGVTLIAPQLAADHEGPLLSLDRIIPVPVYVTREIELREVIADQGLSTVSWDTDLGQDTDGNGKKDDDWTTTGSFLSLSPDRSRLIIGASQTLGDRQIRLRATDAVGNSSMSMVTIRVYAPIPRIDSATLSGSVGGLLDERVPGEPIDLIRVRAGTPLMRLTGSLLTGTGGGFSGVLQTGSRGVEMIHSGQTISLGNLGLLESLPIGYTTRVTPASQTAPMQIDLLSSERVIYSMYLIPPVSLVPTQTGSLGGSLSGIWVIPSEDSRYIRASDRDPYFSGGGYISTYDGVPLAAIHRDGNIYRVNHTIELRYRRINDTTVIDLIGSGSTIASVGYRYDGLYIVK